MKALFYAWLFNIFPPYWGTGIRVSRLSPDWRDVIVTMPLRFYNRNYVGTHFGGSLFAMTDPFLMLMLMKNLGPGYRVWDQSATIHFHRPGRGRVSARFHLDEEEIAALREAAAHGDKLLPQFTVDIRDEAGEAVATVEKTIYIRRRLPRTEREPQRA